MPLISREQLDHSLVPFKGKPNKRRPSNKRPSFQLKFEISARVLTLGNV